MDATPLNLFWKGFTVAHHEFLDAQTLRLQLEPDDRVPPVCSGCDHACFWCMTCIAGASVRHHC